MRIAVIAALTLAFVASAAAQPRPWEPVPRYELRCTATGAAAELDRATATRGARAPGVALALLKDGQPLATRYAGVENLERSTPIGPETRFYIASLAKSITATAALMLRDRGVLKLQDSLGKWVDNLPPCARGVRLIHLLHHTSGLPDYFEAFGDSATGVDNARVLAFVRSLKALEFDPGERYGYSNTGYVVLAEVIGRASGRGFAPFVEDSILRPLGMTSSVLVRKGAPVIQHRATGYRKDGDGHVKDDLRDLWTLGSGGIYSTLPDVITWYRAVVASRLLKPASTMLLFETPVTLSGRKSYLGMGWNDETPGPKTPDVQGLRAYGSFGELAGFRAAILFYPDHGLAWIALSNAGDGAFPPQGMDARLFRRVQ
jgi:CubicO group peptidase (beta-lactamase class C family)